MTALFSSETARVWRRRGHCVIRNVVANALLSISLMAGISFVEVYGNTIANPNVQELDRILVIVNEDIITETELAAYLADVKKQIATRKYQAPPEELLRKQVLERIILERIQLQLAERAGIHVSEQEIDQAIDRVSRRKKVSHEKLYQSLREEGIEPEDFRKQLREQLLIKNLVDKHIKQRITVSENEITQFIENRDRLLGGKDLYDISHIVIPLPESATPSVIQTAKKRSEKILAKLKQGADFEKTAISYSQGKEAMEGGKLGWRTAGQLPDLFVNALSRMKPGEVSGLLRSPNGFHILKLNDRRGGKKSKTVNQTHARHILIRTNDLVSAEEAKIKLQKLRQRILEGEDFATMAKSFSEDSVSAANGGDLGWINPGETVPEFEQSMRDLKPLEIGQPIQTAYGVHLIQVLDRRKRDIGEQLDRNEALRQIQLRKADEKYQQWTRQIRNESYVKYLDGDNT